MRTPEAFARLGGPQEPDAHTGDLFVRSINWKPVIAAVHGAVMGLGLGVAFECDLVVADLNTRFQITETPRGLGGARFWSLLHTCGAGAFATEVALTGRFFSADEAQKAGLVCAVTPDGCVIEHAEALAQRIAANPPLSVQSTVRVRRWFVEQAERMAVAFTDPMKLYLTDDFREAVAAHVEKREPSGFKGRDTMKGVVNLLRSIASRQGRKSEPRPTSPSQTINDVLRAQLTERSNAPAVWVAPQKYRTFSEAFEVVGQIAQALRSQVETSHARIVFATPRGSAGLFGFLSAVEVGTCCPLDAKLTGREFTDALVALEPDVLLVAEPDPAPLAVARAAGIPCVGFRLDTSQSDCTVRTWPSGKACEGRAMRAPLLLRGEEAPAILMRTSGTTADPKLVRTQSCQRHCGAHPLPWLQCSQLVPDDICLTPMPLHHVHGLIAGALSALAAGSSIHCCGSFSPQAFDAALHGFSPTWLTAAPALHVAMCRLLREQRCSPGNIDLAPISVVVRTTCAVFGSHAGGTCFATHRCSKPMASPRPRRRYAPICFPQDNASFGSVGVPINAELLILDDAERKAPPGVDGEILLRGAGVIREYLGTQPDGAFWEGWLRTGDIGHVDGDGYLYVVGRKKEVIKRGGHSVFPLEVDNALTAHPSVCRSHHVLDSSRHVGRGRHGRSRWQAGRQHRSEQPA